MKLELNFRFDTMADPTQGWRGVKMSDFSDFSEYLAGALRAKREDERQKSQKAIQDTSVLTRGFNSLWDGVHKTIQSLRESVNKNPRVGVNLIYEAEAKGFVIARTDVKEKLRVLADPDERTLHFVIADGPRYEKTYRPKLSESQTEFYFVDENDSSTTVEQMCMNAIKAYLGVSR
jgi:hypothetical protein